MRSNEVYCIKRTKRGAQAISSQAAYDALPGSHVLQGYHTKHVLHGFNGNRGIGTYESSATTLAYADFRGLHVLIDLQGIEYLKVCKANGGYTISSAYVVFQTTGGGPVYGTLDYQAQG